MEEFNEPYLNVLENKLEVNICDLAPKVNNQDANIYITKQLQVLGKNSASRTETAAGTLVYKDQQEKHFIQIIIKFFFDNRFQVGTVEVMSLMFEQWMYNYIRDNILVTRMCPNFIGYIGQGKCDQEQIEKITSLENLREKYPYAGNSQVGVWMTQYIGQLTLTDFLNHHRLTAEHVARTMFQVMYICLTLEHFGIMHNDSHLDNFRVELLDRHVTLCYTINGQKFIITTSHIVYLYDWDLSSCEENINPKLTNYFEAYFTSNKFIYKRDFVYALSSITQKLKQRPEFADLAEDYDIYFTSNFSRSIMRNIFDCEEFVNFRYNQNTRYPENMFCFGGNGFEDEMTVKTNYFVGCSSCFKDDDKDDFMNAVSNNYMLLFEQLKDVVLDNCFGYTFSNKLSLVNVENCKITYYYSCGVQLEDMLKTFKFANRLKELVLVLHDVNINNIFGMLLDQGCGNSLETLIVVNSIPYSSERDLDNIRSFPNLKHVEINTPLTFRRYSNPNFVFDNKLASYHESLKEDDDNIPTSRVIPEVLQKAGKRVTMRYRDGFSIFPSLVIMMKTIFFFFDLRKHTDLDDVSDECLLTICLYYVYEDDKFLTYYNCSNSISKVVAYIQDNDLGVADTQTPIDVIYYKVFITRQHGNFPHKNYVYKLACTLLYNAIVSGLFSISDSQPTQDYIAELSIYAAERHIGRDYHTQHPYNFDNHPASILFRLTEDMSEINRLLMM